MPERVGFIGLGLMGRPMARNLLRAGYELIVHSRSAPPVEELVAEGAARAGSPAEAARASDVVVTMLPDTPDVERVLLGDGGVLEGAAPGSLVVDMSTIDAVAAREIADAFEADGVAFLDAPVSGGDVGAREGTLSIMVGGPADAFERARPLFDVLGSTVVHLGGPGAGQITKAANQLIAAETIQAVAEALVLAARGGVDPARVREVLLGGFASSRILELHGARMLRGDFEPGFRAELLRKDVRIVRDTAAELGVPVPATQAVADALDRLLREGRGALDPSALVTVLEDAAGIRVRDAASG
jgi:2-hydroxy-3-oxopropionate reductase